MPLLPGGRGLAPERRAAWLLGVLSGRFVRDPQTIAISNFCRSDSTTVFARSPPSPSPPSPWSWVPTCQFSSYFIILLLVTITLLLFTVHYRHPLTPPALCRYARTP